MKAKNSKANPQAQMAVRCSALFGIVLIRSQKSAAHSVRNCRDGRPCDCARKCTHQTRETHEKKSTPSVKRSRESTEDNEGNEDAGRSFVLLVSLCSKPPGPHAERPKLSDPAHEGVRLQPGRDGRVRCSAWLGGITIGRAG